METLFITIHIITSIFLILFVLIQSGKGAEAGAMFGGASQAFLGTKSGNVLTKITTSLAIIFMATSIVLTFIQSQKNNSTIMQDAKINVEQSAETKEKAEEKAEEKTKESNKAK